MTLPVIPPVELVTTPVRTPNERILELVFADRELTPEEWAELREYETMAQ